MTVGLGVGLVVGAGVWPTAAAAQAGAGALSATARVLPALGALPRDVETSPKDGRTGIGAWQWETDGDVRPALPTWPATAVTRRTVGNRRLLDLAATGV